MLTKPPYSSTELAEYFIKNSSTFFDVKRNESLDKKHQDIINSAYELIKSKEAFSERALGKLGWSVRSLNSCTTKLTNLEAQGLLKYFIVYLLKKILRHKSEGLKYSSLMDDFYLVCRETGLDFIKDNPVSATPGVSSSFRYKGCNVNFRWLRYLYLCNRILNFQGLKKNLTWVDVGIMEDFKAW